jgi:hypothetical protein
MNMHPAVELLLKCIESNPKRYDDPIKWTWAMAHVLNIATAEEAALIRAKLRTVAGNAVHATLMREILK